ncbi:hypothetical protein Y590_04570 [Methylobacterium sp. AMS5]|nr:hypothetical protein Y590_04570 [Methylobacterium sp. AMS5]
MRDLVEIQPDVGVLRAQQVLDPRDRPGVVAVFDKDVRRRALEEGVAVTDHSRGTRNRRVTMASIQMLTSVRPSFHWVGSSARHLDRARWSMRTTRVATTA